MSGAGAIVIGSGGQDGRILVDQLRAAGTRVLGIGRGTVSAAGIPWDRPVDIRDAAAVAEVVEALRPDAVYHLAALHQSSDEAVADTLEAFRSHYEVNFFSLLHCLEAIRLRSPRTRLFFAASSHIFGVPDRELLDETAPLRPDSIYGMTKADGLLACRIYRERHGLFATTGILFTHESPHRPPRFLAMKIAAAVHAIRAGREREIAIGRTDAVIDWGWAPDYCDAMRRLLAIDRPGEFVVATGERHTVADFLRVAFATVGIDDWRRHVREDPALLTRPAPARLGNAARLRAATGWAPTVGFEEMVRRLVASRAPGGDANPGGNADPGRPAAGPG